VTIKAIHIVCYTIPYPVDNDVNFELFYKVVAFQKIGIEVKLHCFRGENDIIQPILQKYSSSVMYYQKSIKNNFRQPYLLVSSQKELLCKNLLKDNDPIIMDGLQTSFVVNDARFTNRKIYVRVHQVEYLNYKALYNSSKWGMRKLRYWYWAKKVKQYEQQLAKKVPIITLVQSDYEYFEKEYQANWASFVPVFFNGDFNIPLGKGDFCVYHGNLSVQENEEAVTWLLENVFNDLEIPFVIAGKNPSKKLIDLSHQYMHTCIAINPSDAEMKDLVKKAQINILPSINVSGIKKKIFNALYNGRFCITNIKGAVGFNSNELFIFANDVATMKEKINMYFNQPFTEEHAALRKQHLTQKYNLEANANRFLEVLYRYKW
jgi:hypothetical protein